MSVSRTSVLMISPRRRRNGLYSRQIALAETLASRGVVVSLLGADRLLDESNPREGMRAYRILPPFWSDWARFRVFWFLLTLPFQAIRYAWKTRASTLFVFHPLHVLLVLPAALSRAGSVWLFYRNTDSPSLEIGAQGFWERFLNRPLSTPLAWLGIALSKRIIVSSGLELQFIKRFHPHRTYRFSVLQSPVVALDKRGLTGPMEILAARSQARAGLAKRFECSEGELLLCAGGELRSTKRLDYLLSALNAEKETNTMLIISGDGPERSNTMGLAIGFGLTERVFLTGWSEDFQTVLLGSDAFVSCAISESTPSALLEAIASGIAVLSPDIPESRELLVHSELLFNPHDVRSLAGILDRIARDHAYLERLQLLCQQRAKALNDSWRREVEQLLQDF